jgi:acetyl-CoA carboxylase carboxyltransferase component
MTITVAAQRSHEARPPLRAVPEALPAPPAPHRTPGTARRPVRAVADDLRSATDRLAARRAAATAGDVVAARARRDRGRLTARDRIELLLDEGSFVETEPFARHRASGFGLERHRPDGDGLVTGWGLVHGRRVAVYAHDARAFGGSLGETNTGKVQRLQDLAVAAGIPVVGINDGGGARIQEGVLALAGVGGIFRRNVASSGVVPQISVIAGACAGGAAYSPALTDFVFMTRDDATMFVTGPDVVAAVTGERVSAAALGGADLHATSTGVATFVAEDDVSCLDDVRYLLGFLPANNSEPAPHYASGDPADRRCPELYDVVPADPRAAYDAREVVASIVDGGELLELHQDWAPNIVCALARVDGHTVGVVANQPAWLAGALDIDAAEKAARFVQTCDAFNIPIVTLVDVPGFLPGRDQEALGIVRRGAKLVHAYCQATVPQVTLVLRKAYGGAFIAMGSRALGADLVYAWPGNAVAVLGPEAAADVIFRKEIAAAADPEQRRQELQDEYAAQLVDPFAAAELGLVDDVIDPADSRRVVAEGLALLRHKPHQPVPRKHSNGPL